MISKVLQFIRVFYLRCHKLIQYDVYEDTLSCKTCKIIMGKTAII